MKKWLKIVLACALVAVLGMALATDAEAQCAMCRATVENNVSSGGNRIGAGLNTGILYLMSVPYLLFVVLAYLWYKQSKATRQKRAAVEARLRGVV